MVRISVRLQLSYLPETYNVSLKSIHSSAVEANVLLGIYRRVTKLPFTDFTTERLALSRRDVLRQKY
jgi:hypothetical protein